MGQQRAQCSAERGKLDGSRTGEAGAAGWRAATDFRRRQSSLCTNAELYAGNARARASSATPSAATRVHALQSGSRVRAAEPVCRFGTELSEPASSIASQLSEFAAGGAELSEPGSGNGAELPKRAAAAGSRLSDFPARGAEPAGGFRYAGLSPGQSASSSAELPERRASRRAGLSGIEL